MGGRIIGITRGIGGIYHYKFPVQLVKSAQKLWDNLDCGGNDGEKMQSKWYYCLFFPTFFLSFFLSFFSVQQPKNETMAHQVLFYIHIHIPMLTYGIKDSFTPKSLFIFAGLDHFKLLDSGLLSIILQLVLG